MRLLSSPRKCDQRRYHRGAFLLEAILATVILAVSISVIIESLVSGLRATQLTGHYSKALLLADHMLSGILAARSAGAAGPQEDQFPEPNEEYGYGLKAEDAAAQAEGLKEVELTVSWTAGRKKQDVSIVTWLFEPPKDENPPQP